MNSLTVKSSHEQQDSEPRAAIRVWRRRVPTGFSSLQERSEVSMPDALLQARMLRTGAPSHTRGSVERPDEIQTRPAGRRTEGEVFDFSHRYGS